MYLARLVWLLHQPDERLIDFVPDDAFYYLRLGVNFVHAHRWSFDGTAPATGFHLLWGYMTAALYAVWPHLAWRAALMLASVFTSASLAVSAMLAASVVQRRFGVAGVVAVAGLWLSTAALPLTTLAMETPLPILAAASSLWLVDRAGSGRSRLVLGFVAGLGGTLGRSDFGLLPLMLLLSTVAFATLKRDRSSPAARISGAIFAGAFAGLVVVLGHCYLVSGHVAQGSAQQKLMWSAALGHNLYFSMDLLRFLDPIEQAEQWMLVHHHPTYRITELAYLLLCAPPLLWAWRHRRDVGQAPALIVAAAFTLLGYVYFYHWDCYSTQIWYMASMLLPLALLLAVDTSLLSRRLGAAAWLLPATLAGFGLAAFTRPLYRDQGRLMAAAKLLRQQPAHGLVGAWNAGILSVVSGNDQLVNLDGLVNDQVHDFAKDGRLAEYLHERGVVVVVDYGTQFTAHIISGIPLERVDRCFGPPQVLSNDHQDGWGVWDSPVVLRPVLPCSDARQGRP